MILVDMSATRKVSSELTYVTKDYIARRNELTPRVEFHSLMNEQGRLRCPREAAVAGIDSTNIQIYLSRRKDVRDSGRLKRTKKGLA
jgi:hypothetical protein